MGPHFMDEDISQAGICVLAKPEAFHTASINVSFLLCYTVSLNVNLHKNNSE